MVRGGRSVCRACRLLSVDRSGRVEWCLSREMLAQALSEHTGHGDVRMWPAGGSGRDALYISLRSPRGSALLELPAQGVESFLRETWSLVPLGRSRSGSTWTASLRSCWREAERRSLADELPWSVRAPRPIVPPGPLCGRSHPKSTRCRSLLRPLDELSPRRDVRPASGDVAASRTPGCMECAVMSGRRHIVPDRSPAPRAGPTARSVCGRPTPSSRARWCSSPPGPARPWFPPRAPSFWNPVSHWCAAPEPCPHRDVLHRAVGVDARPTAVFPGPLPSHRHALTTTYKPSP